jgi:hypothetical protein
MRDHSFTLRSVSDNKSKVYQSADLVDARGCAKCLKWLFSFRTPIPKWSFSFTVAGDRVVPDRHPKVTARYAFLDRSFTLEPGW